MQSKKELTNLIDNYFQDNENNILIIYANLGENSFSRI